ncbi:bifunctional 4-hydroxy-2-oxoglutarate aldolase/2-dehydro-3-deoxy-phosphogluconate aldolase [Flammeovirga sp. SJP92]|uniref:bifunctional 4-hydroxy-2-oxoglutarate aldolase/2-dehydro-3-deoxy-phosphogluconate aldolase n=1 Tax=Flammeovirga sp. SJP92 TaxID=1775430 RepID=UPI0020A55859|nr:bifunctional 4-hydroxy-2-oxoglutarate aldolase/2-dehydro-3-deoxy-phosphogluconate aldolase [Flammeovirga sp. SJP92]
MCKIKEFSWTKFHEAPIVGILRGIDEATINRVIPIYIEAGLSTIEVTLNTPNALAFISKLSEAYPELNVGAGTVCDMSDLDKALEAGSQFIVTPIVDQEVIAKCKSLDIPIFSGALTPTEIYTAWKAGATAVKIFPCSKFGAGYIKDIKAPLNEIKVLPTGGVDSDNIQSFFKAGAYGVGMGGSLFPKDLLAEGKEAELLAHFKALKSTF